MKSSRPLLAFSLLVFAFLFTFATATHTVAHSSAPPPPPVDKRVLVNAVDTTASTVELKYMRNGTTHTYTLDSLSVIKVGDANAEGGKIGDIKVGMQVRDYIERDDHTLDSILVGTADPAPTN